MTLTLPARVAEDEALAFAAEKEAWLRRSLSRHAAPEVIDLGTRLPVEGVPRLICMGSTRRVRLDGDRLRCPITASVHGWPPGCGSWRATG